MADPASGPGRPQDKPGLTEPEDLPSKAAAEQGRGAPLRAHAGTGRAAWAAGRWCLPSSPRRHPPSRRVLQRTSRGTLAWAVALGHMGGGAHVAMVWVDLERSPESAGVRRCRSAQERLGQQSGSPGGLIHLKGQR